MKTKNLVLGLVALTFAIGSAFTSLTPPSAVFVPVYETEEDFDEQRITCLPTNLTCEDSGTGARCSVQIPIIGSSPASTQNTYKNDACTSTILETTSLNPVAQISAVYALAE